MTPLMSVSFSKDIEQRPTGRWQRRNPYRIRVTTRQAGFHAYCFVIVCASCVIQLCHYHHFVTLSSPGTVVRGSSCWNFVMLGNGYTAPFCREVVVP